MIEIKRTKDAQAIGMKVTLFVDGIDMGHFHSFREAAKYYDENPVYKCDPEKNTECHKGPSCQTSCLCTRDARFASQKMQAPE